jgi:hypothetical protein
MSGLLCEYAKKAMDVGIEVHTLADWMEVTRRYKEYLGWKDCFEAALRWGCITGAEVATYRAELLRQVTF